VGGAGGRGQGGRRREHTRRDDEMPVVRVHAGDASIPARPCQRQEHPRAWAPPVLYWTRARCILGGMHAASVSGPNQNRAIRPRDPRALVAAVTALVAATLAWVGSAAAMLGLLGFVCAWHLVVTGDLSVTGASLRRIAPFALLVVALNAVFGPGEAIVALGGVRLVAGEGLANGVFFALRLGVMLMSVSLLLAAASPESLARGLSGLVRRVSRRAAEGVAFFVFLAMGFVPLVAEEFERIRTAQAFRGGDLSGGLARRVESARAWLIPLLVSAVHRSGRLAMAVELRDVRRRLPFTLAPARFRAADAALLLSTAAAIAAASGWVR
jgi:energy-coupling factor transporter transmembrane protein EcfT